jgi:hypothetical protein
MNHAVGHQKQIDLQTLQRCGQPPFNHLLQSADPTTVLTDCRCGTVAVLVAGVPGALIMPEAGSIRSEHGSLEAGAARIENQDRYISRRNLASHA